MVLGKTRNQKSETLGQSIQATTPNIRDKNSIRYSNNIHTKRNQP